MLATPGERGVIGRGQVETQHPEDRRQEAFSLPQDLARSPFHGEGHRKVQVEDEPERQCGFDGEIGILPRPATFADAHGLPSGDRIRGPPHGDIAALDQRSVVCRPIPDVVLCLVLWVHARLHVERGFDGERSCTCCRHDGQEVDRGSPRARDPCTNAALRRYLRLYDSGGAAVSGSLLFVRGVLPGTSQGVLEVTPPEPLLQELDRLFLSPGRGGLT